MQVIRAMSAISAISAIAVLAFGSPANAQDAKPEADVFAVVNTMFEGFAKKDTTIIRGTLHDDVKLVTAVTNREGKAIVRTETSGTMTSTAIAGSIRSSSRARSKAGRSLASRTRGEGSADRGLPLRFTSDRSCHALLVARISTKALLRGPWWKTS